LGEQEKQNVLSCLDSEWISSSGPFVKTFEKSFNKEFGGRYAVAVNSGTMAIDLALKAVGVSAGDEVIVPNFTFVGSISPIYRLHGIPVLAPTEPNGWNMDVEALPALITRKTKAIIAVHLYGIPANIKKIVEIAKAHGVYVIEDCAESLGACVDGQPVGTFGEVGCFSFFGNKVLTTGEGGICITSSEEKAEQIRLYRDHGMTKEYRYWHKVIGYNGRMTNLQAALGCGQLSHIRQMIERRSAIHDLYQSKFKNSPFFENIIIPKGVDPVCWLESPLIQGGRGIDRDQLLHKLSEDGVETRPFFYPSSVMPAFSRFGLDDARSVQVSSHGFNLPTYTSLKNEDIVWIAERTLYHLSKLDQPESQKTVQPHYPKVGPESHIDVTIVLPTFNEENNAVRIIEALRRQMVSVSKEYEIIVMDDCSQDATVSQIKEKFKNDKNVKVVIREGCQRGLALSILDGIKISKGEYILVMDSDFNHDPEVTGQMVKFVEQFDIVSGSRFTTGGGMQNKFRWFCSLIFNLCVRMLLMIPTQDNLAGFFCIRKKALLDFDLNFIFRHYGDYFFRLLFLAHRKGFSILEIPVVYKDRDFGVSKTSFIRTLCLYIREALKLRFGK
jgi:perosamine synthetase